MKLDLPTDDLDAELEARMRETRRQPYVVQVLLERAVVLDWTALAEALSRRVPGAALVEEGVEAGSVAFAFTEQLAELESLDPAAGDEGEGDEGGEGEREGDAEGADEVAPLGIVEGARPLAAEDTAAMVAAAEQTWDWEEARAVMSRCRHAVAVYDGNAGRLPPQSRLAVFNALLSSVLEQLPAAAIHGVPSQRLVDPHAWLHRLDDGEVLSSAAVNVRLFRVEDGKPEEHVMDTMGLAALGLPDVQCHFERNVGTGVPEPGQVAALLFGTADYLYEKGDVIQDGHTVQGVSPKDEWECRHEESLLEPRRIVIDVNPGKRRS